MTPGAQNPVHTAPSGGAERRREKRYQIDLPGKAIVGDVSCPVMISDLSASGALIAAEMMEDVFTAGTTIQLLLDGFGQIDAMIVHVGSGFFGLQFLNTHLFRDRLSGWMRKEVGAP